MKRALWTVAALAFLAAALGQPTPSSPVQYKVQLIWGTNLSEPPKAGFRQVGPNLKRELGRVFQWHDYWEVTTQDLKVQPGQATRVRLSPKCEVEIELISPELRETRIFGEGVLVTKSRRKIHCPNPAIHGGTAEAGGSWFIVVRENKKPI